LHHEPSLWRSGFCASIPRIDPMVCARSPRLSSGYINAFRLNLFIHCPPTPPTPLNSFGPQLFRPSTLQVFAFQPLDLFSTYLSPIHFSRPFTVMSNNVLNPVQQNATGDTSLLPEGPTTPHTPVKSNENLNSLFGTPSTGSKRAGSSPVRFESPKRILGTEQ
jgi:hypothetical protein